MNTIQPSATHKHSTLIAIAAALATAGTLLAVGGEAQARERHSTITGANGKAAQRNVTRQQGDVSSSTTGPNGKTASRNVDRSASGATATVTGPNGQTATRVTTRQP
jgi:hypothetical protein